MTEKKNMGFATRAIHDGQGPDVETGAATVPLYLTSTFELDGIGKHRGHEYSRLSNPTKSALEENLASLEGGASAHVFGSGVAAIAALCTMMKTGDHVVCGENVYGGTLHVFDDVMRGYGIDFTYVDTADAENVARAIRPETRLVHIETPTNPMMTLADIRAVADVCHAKGVDLSVDNTFMSPYFQQPLALGADIVMHSTTKFLNGHSDGLGGVLVCNRPELAARYLFVQKTMGGILSPFECWLVQRGVKTLAVRMKQHDANGRTVADLLSRHKNVKRVNYPGLADHPQHELAKQQMSGFGSLMSFELGSRALADAFLQNVKVCIHAASLGGVETLVCHPATMTHVDAPKELKERLGITDGLVRISVGIEDVEDIIADLEQALDGLE